jgi:hypothetical protein
MFTESRQGRSEPKVRDESSFLLGGGKKCFFIGLNGLYLLMLYSLNSFSFKWRCCSLVLLKSLWQKPVLTTHLSWNHRWGYNLWNALKHTLTMNRTKYVQIVTVNLTQCDCLYPCPFHITFFIPWIKSYTVLGHFRDCMANVQQQPHQLQPRVMMPRYITFPKCSVPLCSCILKVTFHKNKNRSSPAFYT